MPRKSKAALQVAPSTELDTRPPPPADLTQVQAQLWCSVTATKPADWFTADCLPLLSAYCRHCATAMFIDQKIDAVEQKEEFEPEYLVVYGKLLDAREKQTRIITSVATKLRLTPQSKYDAAKADRIQKKTPTKKLWET